eukprot:scaffold23058_cov20-Tisochrysis_lutea.AAC.1
MQGPDTLDDPRNSSPDEFSKILTLCSNTHAPGIYVWGFTHVQWCPFCWPVEVLEMLQELRMSL